MLSTRLRGLLYLALLLPGVLQSPAQLGGSKAPALLEPEGVFLVGVRPDSDL